MTMWESHLQGTDVCHLVDEILGRTSIQKTGISGEDSKEIPLRVEESCSIKIWLFVILHLYICIDGDSVIKFLEKNA